MRIKLLYIIAIVFTVVACSKDKYTSKPQLTFKDMSTTVVALNQPFQINLEFTDKEGDIQDTLWIQKVSKTCPGINSEFTTSYKVPNFTAIKNLKGIIEIPCIYNAAVTGYLLVKGCSNKDDSTYLKFWLKDKAGNRSDTITTPVFVLSKP